MLIIILPGGVSHALAGCCIAAIIIPVTPTTPLKVKKPPLINLFIVVFSYKNIMVPNVISTQGQAALSIIQSAQVPPVEWLVYSFLSCFNLSKDSVLIACSMRQASFSAVFGSTPASISIAEKNWCFSSVISATERPASVKIRKRRSSFAEILSHAERQPRGIHLASIPPDAVLHPQTVPPPFSSEGVG